MLKKSWSYPDKQLNGKAIIDPIQILDLSITTIGSYQKKGYDFVLDSLRREKPILNDPNKGFTVYNFRASIAGAEYDISSLRVR